jgi:hypothetical protein
MKQVTTAFLSVFAIALLAMAGLAERADAKSDYWTTQYCSACHYDDSTSCDGCHAHGVHTKVGGSDINLTAVTDKTTYAPGETVNVTIDGGNKGGWVRAVLYDENGAEAARSEGPGGTGSGEEFFISLTATAPATPGTYTFSASWYGNLYDKAGAAFLNWIDDPNNANHGEEIVSTNSFTVEAAGTGPRANVGVFKGNYWYLDTNANDAWDSGQDSICNFGRAGDMPVTGDWNGDGVTEIGLFRNGNWFLDNGDGTWNSLDDSSFRFGRAGDVPVTGDWNGDGVTEIGLFRNGSWYMDDGDGIWGSGPDASCKLGRAGDVPVTGDWDGNGATEIGLFRNGNWFLDNGDGTWNSLEDSSFRFGNSTHVPVVGIW